MVYMAREQRHTCSRATYSATQHIYLIRDDECSVIDYAYSGIMQSTYSYKYHSWTWKGSFSSCNMISKTQCDDSCLTGPMPLCNSQHLWKALIQLGITFIASFKLVYGWLMVNVDSTFLSPLFCSYKILGFGKILATAMIHHAKFQISKCTWWCNYYIQSADESI